MSTNKVRIRSTLSYPIVHPETPNNTISLAYLQGFPSWHRSDLAELCGISREDLCSVPKPAAGRHPPLWVQLVQAGLSGAHRTETSRAGFRAQLHVRTAAAQAARLAGEHLPPRGSSRRHKVLPLPARRRWATRLDGGSPFPRGISERI